MATCAIQSPKYRTQPLNIMEIDRKENCNIISLLHQKDSTGRLFNGTKGQPNHDLEMEKAVLLTYQIVPYKRDF